MRHIRPQIGEERDSAWVQLGDRRGQHAKSRNAEHIWVWEIEILCVAGRGGMGGWQLDVDLLTPSSLQIATACRWGN